MVPAGSVEVITIEQRIATTSPASRPTTAVNQINSDDGVAPDAGHQCLTDDEPRATKVRGGIDHGRPVYNIL